MASYKNKKLILWLSVFVVFLAIFYNCISSEFVNAKNDSFTDILHSNQVTVVGPDTYLTKFQLRGFVDMIPSKYDRVIDKYHDKLAAEDNRIKLSADEILELQYYTLPSNQQSFFHNISGKKVNVSMTDDAILYSY